jgi:ribose 5-phosphate isomerase B
MRLAFAGNSPAFERPEGDRVEAGMGVEDLTPLTCLTACGRGDVAAPRHSSAHRCCRGRLYTDSGRWQAARPSRAPEGARLATIMNKIFLSSDHAGFSLRGRVTRHLLDLRVPVDDRGPPDASPVDYPDEARNVCQLVRDTPGGRGILICGTGLGMVIAANKVHGIRAVVAWNLEVARLSRQHNDANVLCLGARLLSEEQALGIIDVWLATDFEGGRHATRVAKIAALEEGETGT